LFPGVVTSDVAFALGRPSGDVIAAQPGPSSSQQLADDEPKYVLLLK